MSSDRPPEASHEEFTFRDAHGIDITVHRWAAPEPVGVVQIAHGIGEHALRYARFSSELVRAGFAVYADDHRGHGATGLRQHGGDVAKLGRLGPGGLRAAEAAVLQLTGLIRERHPGLPVVMLAHSWGSIMAQRLLNAHPRAWDALVLSGSAYRTPAHMESGDLNARWKAPGANGFEWLSRDPDEVGRYIDDPLCFGADVLKLFGVADGMRFFGRPGRGLAPDVPIHIVSGADDPLSKRDSLQRLAEAYRGRGVRDVTVKVYPEARHELFNETNRDEVTSDVISWITDRVAPE